MSEVKIIGDFSDEIPEEVPKGNPNSQPEEKMPTKPAEEPKTNKRMSRWKKFLIGAAATLMGTGAIAGTIHHNIEYVRHVENYDAKKVEKVIAPNGLKLRYNKPNEKNINDENEDDYKILQPETPIYVLYGDEVKVHNNIKCLTITFIRAGILGKNGEMIIGWAAEKEVLDNSDIFDKPETCITDFITDVDKIRTARVINKTDIHTGDPVNIAWKTPVYDLGNNKVAFIGENGNVSVIEVEEGDLEGDLSMGKVDNNSSFRSGMKVTNTKNGGDIHAYNKQIRVKENAEAKKAQNIRKYNLPAGIFSSGKGFSK